MRSRIEAGRPGRAARRRATMAATGHRGSRLDEPATTAGPCPRSTGNIERMAETCLIRYDNHCSPRHLAPGLVMPVYTCPECGVKLKRNNPVEPGKKLKCPECSTVFTVRAATKAEPAKAPVAPAPATPAAPKSEWDDDGPKTYVVTEDKESKESEKEREKAYGPLKERFEKSKCGPALPLVVKPANYLLLCGVVTCIMAITTGVVATWEMIFKSEVVEAQGKKSLYDTGEKKTRFKELSADEVRERFIWLAGAVFYFLWGGVVCLGASQMHEVKHYWLAMVGAVMAFIGPTLPIAILFTMWATEAGGEVDMGWMGPAIIFYMLGVPISAWNIVTLLNKKVKAGFADDSLVV